jgi:hypothetical protein
MHLGAKNSSGDPLVFLHVDTRLPDNWQEIIRNTFLESPKPPSCAAFRLNFDSDKPSYRLIAGLSRLRTNFTGVPHGDQALVISRWAYFSSGGFPDVPLMEEYFLIPKLRRLGRFETFRESVLTSARKYEKKGPLRNALANSLLIFLFYIGVPPERLAGWYRWR